jgi:hypothetical protein
MPQLVLLRRYVDPIYPLAEELRERPDLLDRFPSRWVERSARSLLALVLGVVPACGDRSTPSRLPPALGIFYDPGEVAEAGNTTLDHSRAEGHLRAQVAGFIRFLRSSGAI